MINVTDVDGELPLDALSDRFGWPEYLVFAVMLTISAGIGIFYGCFGNKVKTTSELLMGNRNLGVFPVSSSLIASAISAITLLGTPSEMYSQGTLYWMIGISYVFVTAASAFIYLPVFYNLRLMSAYEYLELRFSRSVRLLGSVLYIVQMTTYLAIVVYAPSIALTQVTGINLYGCVVVVFLICTFYTTLGGIRAVVTTDAFQIVVMFAAMIVIIFKGAHDVGGHQEVWKVASEGGRVEFLNFDFDPRTRLTVWGLVIGGYFSWATVYACSQAQVQLYMSLPTMRKAQWALLINLIGLVSILSLSCYAGLIVYAKYASCDPIRSKRVSTTDQIFPLFVMDTLGSFPGLPGLFVAGIFSGSLSTLSSGLNSLAAITLEDFIRGVCYPNMEDAQAAKISRFLATFYGLVSFGLVFLAEQSGGILQASFSIYGIVGGPLLGVYTLGMCFPWANRVGALGGTLCALAFSIWLGAGASVASHMGQIVYPDLPVRVDGCQVPVNVSVPLSVSSDSEPTSGVLLEFYKISFMWYSAIGCCLTLVFGLFLSFFGKPQKPGELNPQLISPTIDSFVRWLLTEDTLNYIGWNIGADLNKAKHKLRKNGTEAIESSANGRTGIENPRFSGSDNLGVMRTANGISRDTEL